jgi:hypothetical protein
MKIHLAVGLASLAAISCGGSGASKGANSPSGDASQIAMTLAGDEAKGMAAGKIDLSGPAFSQFDAEQKALVIYVLDPATQPPPSCDTIGLGAMIQQKSGARAMLVIKDFNGTTGKVKAAMGMLLQGDASTMTTPTPGGALDATTVDITTYDANTIAASITSDSSAKSIATGTISGTVCPNISLIDQAHQAAAGAMGQARVTTVASGPGFSTLSIAMDAKAQITSGGAMVKLDPEKKALTIFAWSDDFRPVPTCEKFATAQTDGKSGRFAAVAIDDLHARATGKFPLGGGMFFEINRVGAYLVQSHGAFDATTIDIKQFDDSAFVAEITSAPTAKAVVTGTIQASVCADGPIQFAGDTSVDNSTKPTKKKGTNKK